MRHFLFGTRRRLFSTVAATVAVVLGVSITIWQIHEAEEARERAELAAELRGEGIPPALAKHLANTLPESMLEGMEGPTSGAEEHFQALAYPDSDVSLSEIFSAQQAFSAVKNGGRVTLFGIPTGPTNCDLANEVIFKGIRVYGITGRRLFKTWYRLTGLFQAGLNIKPVITHTFPMTDFVQGFELINSGQCGKVVLVP